jgi:hypothetical protein
MPNTIRIKRSASAASPGSLLNAELAYSENSNKLFIGVGTGGIGGTATSVVAIGGSGAYFTLDTAQTVASTGVKTFDTTNFKLIGGSSGQFLKTDGTGAVSWADTSVNAIDRIVGNTGSGITIEGSQTLEIFGTGAISVNASDTLYNSSLDTGNTLSISVAAADTTNPGVVVLNSAINSTSTNQAATPKAVKDAYDLAAAALPKGGGEMSGFIKLHADPSDPMHAATRKYVDSIATGLDVKASVRAATTTSLPGTPTYNNGTNNDGVGATITGPALTALGTIDGVTLAVGARILVKDQGSGTPPSSVQNGIYVVTKATAPYGLTRATDADSDSEVTSGMFVFVEEGTRNSDNGFVLNTNGTIDVGTTLLSFTQFSGAGKITAGTGIVKDGDTLSVDLVPAANGGTGITSYTVGDLLYASGSTALSKLADVATGNALISGGVGVAPAWGKIGLGTHVSGTLPVANGGTGITSFGTGVATFLQTPSSANLAAAVTGETGSGALVFASSPTLVTPVIGAATGTSLALTGGSLTARAAATQDAVILAGRAGGTGSFGVTISPTTLTANRTVTLADGNTTLQTGTMAITGGTLGQFASTTSAALAGVINDETGSGALVFATSPSLTTPSLGVATATSINKVSITAPTNSATLTIADGKTLAVNNSFALNGTGTTTTVNFGGGGTVAYTNSKLSAFAATTSAEMAGVIEDETGYSSGALVVFNTSPSFRTSVVTSSSDFEVFNTNATKIDAFGAATAISIGATSGATLIRNKVQLANVSTTLASMNLGTGTVNPTTPVNGDLWVNSGSVKFYNGGAAAVTLLDDDDVIDGGSFS